MAALFADSDYVLWMTARQLIQLLHPHVQGPVDGGAEIATPTWRRPQALLAR
jgi:hypothetical protein